MESIVMSGFLDYLDEFDKKKEKIVKKESTNVKSNSERKSKVLCLNVEVRTPEGANVVIEKLQSWISENFDGNTKTKTKKKPYRIPPKKVNKSPVVETRSHAVNILDGLPDEPVVTEQNQSNINNNAQQHKPQFNLSSVKGHASALL